MKTLVAAACLFAVMAFSGTAEAGWRKRCCQPVCTPCVQKTACNTCCNQPVRKVIKAVLPPYGCRKCCCK